MKKRRRKPVVQCHHISYTPEHVVTIYQGEHWILTQLQRRKRFSQGFLRALRVVLALHHDDAVELKQ